MQVEILTPEKKLFSGEAISVTVPGIDGNFTMLNNHAAIIAALRKGKVKIVSTDKTEELNITGGFAECLKNQVVVLVEGVE